MGAGSFNDYFLSWVSERGLMAGGGPSLAPVSEGLGPPSPVGVGCGIFFSMYCTITEMRRFDGSSGSSFFRRR